MNIDAIRRLLAIADTARDPYTVAEIASGLLTLNAADNFAQAHYTNALSTLKLPASIAWQSRARRFAANLRGLERKDPIGAGLVKAADLSRYQLHQSSDGNYQILDTTLPLHGAWLGGFANHKAAELLWQFDKAKTPVPPPIIFQGLGFAWLFLRVLATTQQTYVNYSPAVHIVEGDAAAMAMLLHMHDLQEAIASPRSHFFIRETPEGALSAFTTAVAENCGLSMPQQFIRCGLRPQAALPFDQTLQRLTQERATRREKLLAETQNYYAGKDRSFWSARFKSTLRPIGNGQSEIGNPSPPLRVLGITSRHTTVLQYSMAELQSAILTQFPTSVEMQIAIEPDDCSLENPFVEIIADFKPDLIIQISRLRHENPAVPKNVPFLCWDQDNLPCMRDPGALADMNGLTFVAGYGAINGAFHLNWPLQNCIFCYPAGMTHRYQPGPLAEHDGQEFAGDLSYVSHASNLPEQLRDEIAARWAAESLPLFHMTAEQVLASAKTGKRFTFTTLRTLIQKAAAMLGTPQVPQEMELELITNLGTIADRAFRHQTLAWVAKWADTKNKNLRLWGKGWENHPTLGKYAAGIAPPGDKAQAVYRATTINLQIIETGLIHSRVLDGWACGGFFLVRQSHLEEEQSDTAAMWRIAQLAAAENIITLADLDSKAGAELKSLWPIVANDYKNFSRTLPFPGFRVWRSFPQAQHLIPSLPKFMFNTEEEFVRLADRYIASPEARNQVIAETREALDKHLSYDARARLFLSHLRDNL